MRAGSCAELDVVDVLGDRRVVAANRALRVAADRDLVPRRVERVEEQQATGKGLARAEHELERLGGLHRADDAGQHAEHAALGAARGELRRRRGGVEAAVARAVAGMEDRHLALEPVDRAVHDGDPVPHRGVVHEVAGGEVVGAVDDDVPAVGEDALDVLGGEALLVRPRRSTSGLSAWIVRFADCTFGSPRRSVEWTI